MSIPTNDPVIERNSIYPLSRSELGPDLEAGERKLTALMAGAGRVYQPLKTIVASDQDHGFVYRLRSGWCARARHLRDGRSQIIAVLLPNDLFGVRTMYIGRQPDEVFALAAVNVDVIDQKRLREAIAADAQLALRVHWQMIEDDRRVPNLMVGLGRGSAEERLALLLLDLKGRLALGGVLAPEATEFALPMTQLQIGDVLGLTAVHVNRTIKRFREAGLATVARGRAELGNIPALYRLAHPMLDIYDKERPEFGAAAA